MNMPTNPLDDRDMTWRQVLAVAVTVILNALDGFDVLSISFASPGIAEDWGIGRAALGIVLSMELVGMALGSVVLGRFGDAAGRRPTMLLSLVLMATGMFLASTATNIATLSAYRIVTGLGIGGMLAVTNAVASEMSNRKYRSLAVSTMVVGYPVGAIFGGMIVAELLNNYAWPVIFEFGAVATAIMIPVVWFAVPETPAFLIARRRNDALVRVNAILARLGQPAPLPALPSPPAQPPVSGLKGLFGADVRKITVLLTAAYFTHIISFYFILKWTPKIVTDLGFTPSLAAGVLVWANVGGAIGGAIWGLAATRLPIKSVSLVTFLAAAIMVTAFGAFGRDLDSLSLFAALGGFCTNAGMVALYNLAAIGFPDRLRATGTGFVIGMGRGGAVLGPIFAGFLFESGFSLATVAAIMACGSLFALIAVALMHVPAKATGKEAEAQA
jgi:benzoate transport